MDINLIFQIIETGTGILKNHFAGKTAEVAEGVLDLERLIKAGAKAVRDQEGQPIDPGLVDP